MIIRANANEIPEAINYICDTLKEKKVASKDVTMTALRAEDIIGAMIRHAAGQEERIGINVIARFDKVTVCISAQGDEFSMNELASAWQMELDDESDAQVKSVITDLYKRVFGNSVSLKNSKGVNKAVITVTKSKYRQLFLTLGALAAGILAGILLKTCVPEEAGQAVTENLLSPVNTMFMNALKMVVAPLVLFSIASSIADLEDMKTLGRIAGKVVGMYFVTSMIAILVGIATWHIFPIGDAALKAGVSSEAAAATIAKGEGVSTSVIDTIVGIIPSDIINPFLSADMLQIIFIAVMIGVSCGLLSDKIICFKDVLSDGYQVFSKITALIISVMPLAVFCAMAKMVLSMDLKSLFSVFAWVPTIYFGDVLMMIVYALIILLVGRLNPITFFRKYYPAMLTAFTFASSNASLPTSIATCDRSLGISKKIYSFSLPLGATINMDGSCITQIVSALFMAKIFGIPVNAPVILTLAITVFVLSVGAPGVPGGALVCISLLVPQIGIPAEAISLIMGLYSLVAMMQTCTNVTGDAAVTLVVARSEGMLDREVYDKGVKH